MSGVDIKDLQKGHAHADHPHPLAEEVIARSRSLGARREDQPAVVDGGLSMVDEH